MKLTVVGSAPAWTRRPGNSSSCYLVEHESTQIVLDFGQGSFAQLWQHTKPSDVAAVAISHMHADHNVDLIPLRHWVKFDNRGYGPALFTPTALRKRFGDFQSNAKFMADFAGESLRPGTFAVGDLKIEARRVTHIPDSWAFRVSAARGDGPALVYSGDCGDPADLVPLIRSGDTLLCEAAFGDKPEKVPIHLSAEQAAKAAATGGARRLVLTHITDRADGDAALRMAEKTFTNDTQLATPGLTVDIR